MIILKIGLAFFCIAALLYILAVIDKALRLWDEEDKRYGDHD